MAKKRKANVDVDTGTLMVIDPAYLFSKKEWRGVVECAYPSRRLLKKRPKRRSFKACIQKALEKRRKPIGDFAVIHTGGDGGFPVSCKQNRAVIDQPSCKLEK